MKKFISSIVAIATLCVAVVAQASESFGGLGISVYPGKKGASVASVLPNSPASQAGLQAGDMIISVNGTALSSVEPEKQLSMLRGNTGSIVNLLVQRNGENLNISSMRVSISVQDLESQEVSAWFGKSKNVTVEELNYLASLKIDENHKLLGVMQNGLLVDADIENLNPRQMQHISLKKEAAKEDNFISPAKTTSANTLNFANRGTISFSLADVTEQARISVFNAKGATVWQKNLGKLPAGISNVGWDGASLPTGSYQARLETSGAVLTKKFELK